MKKLRVFVVLCSLLVVLSGCGILWDDPSTVAPVAPVAPVASPIIYPIRMSSFGDYNAPRVTGYQQGEGVLLRVGHVNGVATVRVRNAITGELVYDGDPQMRDLQHSYDASIGILPNGQYVGTLSMEGSTIATTYFNVD